VRQERLRLVRVNRYQSRPIAEATIKPLTNDVPNSTQTVVHIFASSRIVLSQSRSVEISHSIVRISNSQEPTKTILYKKCNRAGCYAEAAVNNAVVAAMKTGKKVAYLSVDISGRALDGYKNEIAMANAGCRLLRGLIPALEALSRRKPRRSRL
jgi:Invasion associated locus B (IalB) protein